MQLLVGLMALGKPCLQAWPGPAPPGRVQSDSSEERLEHLWLLSTWTDMAGVGWEATTMETRCGQQSKARGRLLLRVPPVLQAPCAGRHKDSRDTGQLRKGKGELVGRV